MKQNEADRLPEQVGTKAVQFRNVDINDLRMGDYQRPTSDRQVKSIAKAFDAAKAGMIIVSERDGALYLVDGSHRVCAMRIVGIDHCPAIVLLGMSAAEEAEYFRRQGENTRKLNSYDLFKAGIFAGDPICLAISETAKKYNYTLGPGHRLTHHINAVVSLTHIYKLYGLETLDTTFSLISQTWDGVEDTTNGECLLGVAEFVHRFGTIDFVDRFQKIRFSLIQQRYKMLKDGMPNGKAFCMALAQRYNDSVNPKKRLVVNYDD